MEPYCRLCAAQQRPDLIDIFSDHGIEQGLLHKIQTCLKITISKDDPLPKQVCMLCRVLVNNVCSLIDIFQAAQLRLNQLFTSKDGSKDPQSDYRPVEENFETVYLNTDEDCFVEDDDDQSELAGSSITGSENEEITVSDLFEQNPKSEPLGWNAEETNIKKEQHCLNLSNNEIDDEDINQLDAKTVNLPSDLNMVVQQHEGNFKRLKKWMEKIEKKISVTETMSIQLEQQHSEIEKLKSKLHRLTNKTDSTLVSSKVQVPFIPSTSSPLRSLSNEPRTTIDTNSSVSVLRKRLNLLIHNFKELDDLERLLHTDPEARPSLERYLNRFGYPCENGKWSEQPQLIKYYLKAVFSTEISAHVNMTGGHGKVSLPNTEVFRIISELALTRNRKYTIAEILMKTRRWLRTACEKQRKLRMGVQS